MKIASNFTKILTPVIATPLFLLGLTQAHAIVPLKNACDQAAIVASNETNVPLSVLMAVTRTETGRTRSSGIEPWPWSINVEGHGSWLSNKVDAEILAKTNIQNGKRNIDIGCFQLNLRWHGHAFSSVSAMLDPENNARYAAKFLSRLFEEKGDWTNAVGAFHSRTRKFSDIYKKKYAAIHSEMKKPGNYAPEINSSTPNLNRFPLLKRSTTKPTRGSLVPLVDDGNRESLLSRDGKI